MSEPSQSTELEDRTGLDRLIFFSDAVFAIAITLLALDLHVDLPSHPTPEQTFTAIQHLGPSLWSFFLSFAVIGLMWIGHHRMFRYIARYDNVLMLLNLLLLMLVAFLPFPTRLIGAYRNQHIMILYALTLTLAGIVSASMWLYSLRVGHLFKQGPGAPVPHRSMFDLFFIPVAFLASAFVAAWSPDVAWAIWWALLIFSIADGLFRRSAKQA